MKKTTIFLFILLVSIINATNLTKLEANYYYENGEYYIDFENHTFVGTSIHPFENGFVTLVTLEETAPVWLRIYNEAGLELSCQKLKKVINLSTSKNKQFIGFYDGESINVINSKNLITSKYKGSPIFAIDNLGRIASTNNGNVLNYLSKNYVTQSPIRKILFFKKQIIFNTKEGLFTIDEEIQILEMGNCIDFEIKENNLYSTIVERNGDLKNSYIYQTTDLQNCELIEETQFNIHPQRTHEDINSPLNYNEENYSHPIGNSYAEIQQYGETAYLHPGVDFLGEDFQDVYAVHDGFVKAILTTGGEPYWRIAIANEDTANEVEGYLYAHLNQDSFTVGIGDFVEAGDIIGTLFPWNYYDFTHTHYARIIDTGETWSGDWWTIDNPLVDTINLFDEEPPVFQNAYNYNMFAFRDSIGNYLEPYNLSGRFDIIAKCYDTTNSDWKIDIWEIGFELATVELPDTIIYSQNSFAYDFPLDTYGEGSWDNMVLNTIYSRDESCFSLGNYDQREYFHLITNSDGDNVIDETDAANMFDSSQFNDGNYILRVTARDASLNETSAEMILYFDNGVDVANNSQQLPETLCYPNPFILSNTRNAVTFSFESKNSKNRLIEIFNLKGQIVQTINIQAQNSASWNGKDLTKNQVSSGVYFYRITTDGLQGQLNKMLLLK